MIYIFIIFIIFIFIFIIYIFGFNNIICGYEDGNVKSKGLIEKIGFKLHEKKENVFVTIKYMKDYFNEETGINYVDLSDVKVFIDVEKE